jgi:hypothetical protein
MEADDYTMSCLEDISLQVSEYNFRISQTYLKCMSESFQSMIDSQRVKEIQHYLKGKDSPTSFMAADIARLMLVKGVRFNFELLQDASRIASHYAEKGNPEEVRELAKCILAKLESEQSSFKAAAVARYAKLLSVALRQELEPKEGIIQCDSKAQW